MKIGGQIHGMLFLSAERSRLFSEGKPHMRDVFGNHPIIPFGSLFEYYPISAKDQSRIHQSGKKVLP